MASTVSVRDGIEYGFGLLAYILGVGIIGGIIALVGFSMVRGNLAVAAIGLLMVLVGIIIIYAGFLGIAYKVIADGVKVGVEAADGGTFGSESKDSSGGKVLFSGEDVETVQPGTFTHYDFQIPEYGYEKGKFLLGIKTMSPGMVDVLVTTQQDRERAQSVEDLTPIDRLSRYDVEDEKIEGIVDSGEWSIVLLNSGTESVDVEFAYRIEGMSHS